MTLAENILAFQKSLALSVRLPVGVEVMNPYRDETTFSLCEKFYRQYYSDPNPRTLILGINPGRFGGGITGIPFTDPIKLETSCGIKNPFTKKTELSADFVYRMIGAYGGPEKFYKKFYIGAVSPLGFTHDGKNMNYYDDKQLQEKAGPFILTCLQKQLDWGLRREVCFCLGEGQNFQYLSRLNESCRFFKKIVPLAHPRFIMQYRRKQMDQFISDYLAKLG